ncbi:MAG: hypothetical protein A2504_08405 [Bdellovibrionales bacterium RIFOXYD12_FULL_39_22]|nr:MAG: hypothetical protein A2385_01630 [Bdellovibrionales bacterium RIFOXYB1_FULL_39_21]OFZ42854.1 MAG: hypothetical protein A2485_10740 [Bdellovibrionales bacterium RIFOXYC12_FULL_39_17]OFZ47486.1 MAG: hypothetical protein A2404_14550 [Bdellovibrionales bacterium RIFOXYC1_FULL_39_130]OFZ75574.1 MAG: hypothetical protein A2560_14700 [Bdellovibrionales bacterium RIFOXYD1_FULL_39_84]OFZ93897.1 MAG: hypothetical protein A2504_08405 [Bdellovibrionales bacterium RIFOXYD12_FULL_39_22]HLE10097.1 hy
MIGLIFRAFITYLLFYIAWTIVAGLFRSYWRIKAAVSSTRPQAKRPNDKNTIEADYRVISD